MNDESENNTDLDALSRGVPESQVPEGDAEAQKARRLATMQRAVEALRKTVEKIEMIERAMGQSLSECLNEQPLGGAVDLISDLDDAIKRLHGDGGALVAAKKRVTFCKEVTMPTRFDAEQIKTFNTDRFRVTKTARVMASINPEGGVYPDGSPFAGQPMAYEWLRENDLESLIKPTVNASSLAAAAKEAMENGMELPEEYFRVHTQPSISITKKR